MLIVKSWAFSVYSFDRRFQISFGLPIKLRKQISSKSNQSWNIRLQCWTQFEEKSWFLQNYTGHPPPANGVRAEDDDSLARPLNIFSCVIFCSLSNVITIAFRYLPHSTAEFIFCCISCCCFSSIWFFIWKSKSFSAAYLSSEGGTFVSTFILPKLTLLSVAMPKWEKTKDIIFKTNKPHYIFLSKQSQYTF